VPPAHRQLQDALDGEMLETAPEVVASLLDLGDSDTPPSHPSDTAR
jgi:hypothetical protein